MIQEPETEYFLMCFSVLHDTGTRDWILHVLFCFTWYRNQRLNTSFMCFSVLHDIGTRDWILPWCTFLVYMIWEPETEYFLYVLFCFTWYGNQKLNTSFMCFSVLHDTGVDPTQWCLVFLCAVNVGQATFEALAQIVRRVHELLEDKNDHNGRNSVLASYIQYCCTLPHQGLLHQCWF